MRFPPFSRKLKSAKTKGDQGRFVYGENQMINSVKEVLEYFPYNIQNKITEYGNKLDSLEEIRVRANRNILLKIGQDEFKVDYLINTNEILEILQRICDNSIYTYQNQICNGFITIKGRT